MQFKQILCAMLMACTFCVARPISTQQKQVEVLHSETSMSQPNSATEMRLPRRQLIDPISRIAKVMEPQHQSSGHAPSLPEAENSHISKREDTDWSFSFKCMFLFVVDSDCWELSHKPVPPKESGVKPRDDKSNDIANAAAGEIGHLRQDFAPELLSPVSDHTTEMQPQHGDMEGLYAVLENETGSSGSEPLQRRSDWGHFWKCITHIGYPC